MDHNASVVVAFIKICCSSMFCISSLIAFPHNALHYLDRLLFYFCPLFSIHLTKGPPVITIMTVKMKIETVRLALLTDEFYFRCDSGIF